MAKFITVTVSAGPEGPTANLHSAHLQFEAASAQEAAEKHREVNGSDVVLVFELSQGRKFKKASMVEVTTPSWNLAQQPAYLQSQGLK